MFNLKVKKTAGENNMQNLFVDKDDVFKVNFSVATDKRGTIFCDLNQATLKDGLKAIDASIDDYEIQDYYAIFKRPSFGDTMQLYDSVFTTSDGNSVNFNPIIARYRKIALLIQKWNLTGEEKKPTTAEIESLHPVIANAIGIQVDLETGGLLQ